MFYYCTSLDIKDLVNIVWSAYNVQLHLIVLTKNMFNANYFHEVGFPFLMEGLFLLRSLDLSMYFSLVEHVFVCRLPRTCPKACAITCLIFIYIQNTSSLNNPVLQQRVLSVHMLHRTQVIMVNPRSITLIGLPVTFMIHSLEILAVIKNPWYITVHSWYTVV